MGLRSGSLLLTLLGMFVNQASAANDDIGEVPAQVIF